MASLPIDVLPPDKPALRVVDVIGDGMVNAQAMPNVAAITVAKLNAIFAEGGINPHATMAFPTDLEKNLAEVKTVEDAMPLIAEMAKIELESKGKQVFPRRLLRIQHVAAFVIMNPFCSNTDICRFFQVSPSAITNIMRTDTFKSLVEAHKVVVDGLDVDIQQQMRDTLIAAVEVVQKDIIHKQDGEFALQAMDKISNRLGMGGRHQSSPTVQINNIITADMIAAARARRLPGAG